MGDALAGAIHAPTFNVPASVAASRYAAQPVAPAVAINYDRLAHAMANVQMQVQANLKIGNKHIAMANIEGRRELRLPSYDQLRRR